MGTRRVVIHPIVAAVTGVLLVTAPAGAYQRPGQTSQLDLAADGSQPISGPEAPNCSEDDDGRWSCPLWSPQQTSISGDGRYVAFSSFMTNLVERDTNLTSDVFVRDTVAGGIERVSISSTGVESTLAPRSTGPWITATNGNPSISRNGRFVAFTSSASNLVAGDTNSVDDVFVHDRKLGTTQRVSVGADGTEGNGSSYQPSISATGRYVAFGSTASNFAPDHQIPGNSEDFFVHDRKRKVTEMVSVTSGGSQGVSQGGGRAGVDGFVSISGTGRYVAFSTPDTDLVDGDTGIDWDVFLHDRKVDKTEIVSLAVTGSPPGDKSSTAGSWMWAPGGHAISDDGRYVAYASTSSELIPNDRNQIPGAHLAPTCCVAHIDTFVYDRQKKRTERVSVTSDGAEQAIDSSGGLGSGMASLSSDGRYVIFLSTAGNLAADDTSYFTGVGSQFLAYPFGDVDAFVYDRETGSVEMVSRDSSGAEGQGCFAGVPAANPDAGETFSKSDYASISNDGRYVAFTSCAPTLRARGDDRAKVNPWFDVFLRDRGRDLGVGTLGGSSPAGQDPPDDRICVTNELCIPPGGAVFASNDTGELDENLIARGAELQGASLAYRPRSQDLFAAIELEHMPRVVPGRSPMVYGLRFRSDDRSYEVRATSLNHGTFGLFDCSGADPSCTKVTDLRGGYGTTGMRVVFTLPLEDIGIGDGGELSDVVAFSGLGSYPTGVTTVLDRVAIE